MVTLTQTKSDPVDTTELKRKFQARSIPLEKDFHDLIEMADAGRLAAGLSPEQDSTKASARTGLFIDSAQRLAIQRKDKSGLDVDNSGVGVVANTAKSIEVNGDGVGVVANTAKGIEVNGDGVGVVANTAKGIVVNGDGVGVVANTVKGIVVDGNGVALKADATLQFASDGSLSVAAKYLTKTGDNTITGGSLSFADDNQGVKFLTGGKIVKKYASTTCWYRDASNNTPRICNNDGTNESNIATEKYVDDKVAASLVKGNGIEAGVSAVTVRAKAGGGLVVSSEGVAVDEMFQIRMMAWLLGGAQYHANASGFDIFYRVVGSQTRVTWVCPPGKAMSHKDDLPALGNVHARYTDTQSGDWGFHYADFDTVAAPGKNLQFFYTDQGFSIQSGWTYGASVELTEYNRL